MQVQEIVERAVGRAPRAPAGKATLPRLSGGLPFIGHSVEFVRGAIELLARAQREHGEIVSFDIFNRRMVAMFGPEAHEAVFRAPDSLMSPMEAYKIMTPVFGAGIVYDATPERMAEQLKMLLPALKDKRMRTYGEAVVLETEDSIRSWGQSGVIDLVDFCRQLTNFTSSRCLLGKEFREGMNEEFASVYHDLEGGVTPLAYINAELPIPAFRRRDKARVRMVEMISSIIQGRLRDRREGEDFLQTLMDSSYATGEKLTDHEITGLLLAGMFAGHHTSSVATAFTLLDLLQNPLLLQRAVAEIDRVFAGGKPVTHAALRELHFIECAIKESLRLHPPLFMLVRVALQDFEFKNYVIPKGTWVVVSPTVSHRIPSVFPDPDAFDPDRFLPPREEDKRDFAYIAFGGGRHKCLGNAFAILQIKAILALLLGQFEFGLCGDAIRSNFAGLVVGPEEPCRVRYRRRAQPSVSMGMGAELQKLATAEAATAAGCPAHGGHAVGEPPPACPAHAKGASGHGNQVDQSAALHRPLSIKLDRDLCQGHAVCVGEAPELFCLGEDGKVSLVSEQMDAALRTKAEAASQFCPTRAIRVVG
jgi:sterol 14-demethylase